MKSLLKKINQAGLESLADPLDFRRVLFVNNLSLISCIVCLAVTAIVLVEGLFPQYLVTAIGGILFSFAIYLNHIQRYFLARTYFLVLSIGVLILACFVAFRQARFNETENILIGFMAVSYLLYDGKFRYVSFLFIYGVLIWMKFIKNDFADGPYDLNFYLNIQNTSILCLMIFFFVDAFRKSLLLSFLKLKDKDEILYSMIDTVPLFIGLVGKDLRYKMVNINYEKAFGKKRDEIIGSSLDEVLPPNILNVHKPMVLEALNGGSPDFLEHTKMPDGTSFYAGGKYIPVRSNSGEIIGASVFVNDVTKLEVAKNKLKAANSTKDKLFSIVAHDIRGPLDLFEGLLDVSADGKVSPKDFLKHQERVREKLTGLRETVNTLLEWARTQLDGVNSSPTSTEIREIVKTNLNLYKELIDQKKINTKLDIEKGICAWIDTNHLKIGVRNMIHNALKFTPRGGDILVKGAKKGDKVILSIKDSGIGMKDSMIQSILKKELQTSAKGTMGEAGTGLGLSLSLDLLEKNNCQVNIESKPGAGTQITIVMLAHQNGH
jgi:PAS domain S-box-containing protein